MVSLQRAVLPELFAESAEGSPRRRASDVPIVARPLGAEYLAGAVRGIDCADQ